MFVKNKSKKIRLNSKEERALRSKYLSEYPEIYEEVSKIAEKFRNDFMWIASEHHNTRIPKSFEQEQKETLMQIARKIIFREDKGDHRAVIESNDLIRLVNDPTVSMPISVRLRLQGKIEQHQNMWDSKEFQLAIEPPSFWWFEYAELIDFESKENGG